MLAPGLATMLVVITTDAVLDAAQADAALRSATRVTLRPARLRRLHVDERPGDALASGASRRHARPRTTFARRAHRRVLRPRAAAAGRRRGREPRHHDRGRARGIRVDDAVEVGRSVARNNLFKAAIFGNDPNWGRVLAAIGTTEAAFDPYDVDVWMNGVRVCSAGRPRPPARRRRPHAARDAPAHRPQGRRRRRDDPHERPHARLRAREQRVRLHERHRSAGHRPRRGAATRPRP